MKKIIHIMSVLALCLLGLCSPLQAACDFTSSQDLVVTPSGTHNAAPGFVQVYLLTDLTGTILSTSSTGNFGPQAYGNYRVHALNYESANPPTPLPTVGVDVATFSGGCFQLFSNPATVSVCGSSVLTACENSGEVITLVSMPDYNDGTGFNQAFVIVDSTTGFIVAVSSVSAVGSATFTTTSGSGDLQAGGYHAYAVNYQDPETLISLGLALGNPWTGNFGVACANSTGPVAVSVSPPGACAPGISVLLACENSGEVISIYASGYTQSAGFNQAVVVVDDQTGLIAAVKMTDAFGFTVFSTTTGTGELQNGSYWVYNVNFEDPATLASIGATLGSPWPLTFGVACVDTSTRVPAVVTPPGSCVALLPVNVVELDGKVVGNHHLLNWHAEAAGSLAESALQVGTNEIPFHDIHSLDWDANQIAHAAYTHVDPAYGENFYRLRFRDHTGAETFSEIVQLDQNNADYRFQLMPNPSRPGAVKILLGSEPVGPVHFQLSDLYGRIILPKQGLIATGKRELSLESATADLASGMYLIHLQVEGQWLSPQRLVIQ